MPLYRYGSSSGVVGEILKFICNRMVSIELRMDEFSSKTAITDTQGHFVIRGIRPGAYTAFATTDRFVNGTPELLRQARMMCRRLRLDYYPSSPRSYLCC